MPTSSNPVCSAHGGPVAAMEQYADTHNTPGMAQRTAHGANQTAAKNVAHHKPAWRQAPGEKNRDTTVWRREWEEAKSNSAFHATGETMEVHMKANILGVGNFDRANSGRENPHNGNTNPQNSAMRTHAESRHKNSPSGGTWGKQRRTYRMGLLRSLPSTPKQ